MGDGKQRKQRKQHVVHRIPLSHCNHLNPTAAAAATAASSAFQLEYINVCYNEDVPCVILVDNEPTTMDSVASEEEADRRELAGYSVQFQIQDTLKFTVRELERQ